MNEFEGKTWVGLQVEKMHAKVPHGGTPMAEQDRDDHGRFSGPGGGGGASEAAHEATKRADDKSRKADKEGGWGSHGDAAYHHEQAAKAHRTAAEHAKRNGDTDTAAKHEKQAADHDFGFKYHADKSANPMNPDSKKGGLSDEEKNFFREENKRDPHGDKEGYGRGRKK